MFKNVKSSTVEIDARETKVSQRYQVAKFNFEEVSDVYAITLWILLGSLAKIGKNKKKLQSSTIFHLNNNQGVTFLKAFICLTN